MNYARIATAAVVAWIVDSIYGFLVYAKLLAGDFAAFPAVFRSEETMNLPLLFAGTLLACFALAYMYAKGYEGGSGPSEGTRFGVLVALFVLGYVAMGNYATLNIASGLAGRFALAAFIEMTLVGTVIGALYKPVAAGSAAGRATRV
jgi:hypothetical protein